MKIDAVKKMRNTIYIDLPEDMFKGDILDVGMDNYGIVYSMYKNYNEEVTVDYVHGKEEKEVLEGDTYDNCILLFSLSNIWLKFNKDKFFRDIYRYLKENGTIHIWDIDKGYSKLAMTKIKVQIPGDKTKEFNVTDLNILKDTSQKTTLKLIEKYFEIIDLKTYDNIYYIRGRRKGSIDNDNNLSRGKFKVHTQQLGVKISKSIYKRFRSKV